MRLLRFPGILAGVTYSSTKNQIEEGVAKIKEMLENHPDIHKDVIFVYFTDFGGSALEIFLYFFTRTTNWKEFLSVRQDVNIKIMDILEKLGMTVAFPSQSLYIEKVNPGAQEQWENLTKQIQDKEEKR